MALFSVNTFRGGGVEHSAAMLRAGTLAATAGRDYAIGYGTMVTAPGGMRVRVSHQGEGGLAVVKARYSPQAYAVSLMEETGDQVDVTLQPTGATGRSDLIVLRVSDPDEPTFGWQTGDDIASIEVIPGVASTVTHPHEVAGYPYPAVPLARVTLPPNTTSVAFNHITDLRPRPVSRETTTRVQETYTGAAALAANHGGTDEIFDLRVTLGEREMPLWATYCDVDSVIEGVVFDCIGGTNPWETLVRYSVSSSSEPAFTRETPVYGEYQTGSLHVTSQNVPVTKPMILTTRIGYSPGVTGRVRLFPNSLRVTHIITWKE